ncbi:hypothetical protein DXG01_007134 [Tephrocybe rancida]|nr:hypothetical protein DXG01_007134 [Tephrocybe rancida]
MIKFTLSAAILSLAGLVASTSVPRQSCPNASRYGVLNVSPTTVKPGDNITVTVDLNCGIGNFGIVPRYLDYKIEVPTASNNGHEPPIVLARRDFVAGGANLDVFTVKVPFSFYFAGAPYVVALHNTYPVQGSDGSEVLIEGEVYIDLTINV